MSESSPYRNSPSGSSNTQQSPVSGVDHLLNVVHQLEADLDTLRDDLAKSQRLATLGTLSAMVAHETANLLTPVTSYAQLALSCPENAELTQKALHSAVEGVERVTKITTSMLGLAGGSTTDIAGGKVCDLREILNRALDCLAREPERDGITLDIEIEDVSLAISGVELQQVILNLLINARRAMLAKRRGQHRLKIAGRCIGGAYEVVVSDTGPGIPASVEATLFDPFVTSVYTDDQRATPRGTGLGLSICRDLLARAGGSIEVQSSSPRGTSFVVTLPVSERDDG